MPGTSRPFSGLPARLHALVAEAHARARSTRQAVLVSVVERVASLDPLGALAAIQHAAAQDAAMEQVVGTGLMYWDHPSARLAMSAIGAATTIEATGAARFADADRRWRALLDSALVSGLEPGVSSAGPMLLGGASFEDDGPRTPLWEGFGSLRFVVPAMLVSLDEGVARITVNVIVDAQGVASPSLDALGRLRDVAIGSAAFHADPLDGADERPVFDVRLVDVRPRGEWRATVADAVAAIEAGALRKVVLARAVRADVPRELDPLALLDHLRHAHRESYVFGCWRGTRVFAGASPERLVRLAEGVVDASSLAGSAPRGADPVEDSHLARGLTESTKDLAEHALVRTALVDALGRFCDDVHSDDVPSMMTLPHVHHLHTAVRARLRAGHSLLELVGALHPTPAVGGTPRDRALAFLREREQLDRGWYASPIGWIGRDAGELAVGLRSAVLSGTEATLFAGCGIVAGSDPERELAESQVKLRPMRSAIAAILGGEDSAQVVGAVGAASVEDDN